MELNAMVNFPRNSPAFWPFLHIKLVFSYLGFNQITCWFLVRRAFYHEFHTQRAKPDRQQPMKEPSLNLSFLCSCLMYLRSFDIAIYLWLGSLGDTTEFYFAFRSKITWNYIFLGNLPYTNNFDFLSVRGTAISIIPSATVVWYRHQTLSLQRVL